MCRPNLESADASARSRAHLNERPLVHPAIPALPDFKGSRTALRSWGSPGKVSIKEVSTLMGHSSPITLSTYARSMEGMGRKAVDDLAKSLLRDGVTK